MSQLHPKIYVVCSTAYYKGLFHGKWIDPNQCVEKIQIDIEEMLSESPIKNARKWMIDATIDFVGIRIKPNEDLRHVSKLAGFFAKYGELGGALLDHFLGDFQKTEKAITQAYIGAYEEQEEFEFHYLNHSLSITIRHIMQAYDDKNLSEKKYVDDKDYAKDLLNSNFFFLKVGTKTHMFRNT